MRLWIHSQILEQGFLLNEGGGGIGGRREVEGGDGE
jgi:hypothetical protein